MYAKSPTRPDLEKAVKSLQVSILIIISTLGLILAQGCSSSGGDGATPTDPNTVFQLFDNGYFTPGYTNTTDYVGSDTKGSSYTAIISSQTQTQSTFLGQPAIPILQQIQITNTSTGASVSDIGTGYYSIDPNDRHFLGQSSSTSTTVSAVTSPIPQTAKIGDFGTIGTYTDNAGDVASMSWRLDDGLNGNGKAVILSNVRDQFGNLDYSQTSSSIIDPSGNTISSQYVIYYEGPGVTVTLNSR